MPLIAWIAILGLWVAAGLFGSLFFFSAGFRFEPRRGRVSSEEEVADRETA